MSGTITLSERMMYTALASVMSTIGFTTDDPAGLVPVVKGQDNRVPQPIEPDHLVMWLLMRDQLATNIDTDVDTKIQASITNGIMVVTNIDGDALYQGMRIYGAGVASNCRILGQRTGDPGDIGNYNVSATPNLSSSLIYAGTHQILNMIDAVIQIDVHGPSSADNATRLAAYMRDNAAVTGFADLGLDIAPLYVVPPRQAPFDNAEDQWEDRWVVELHLQINPVVVLTQEFAEQLEMEEVISVQAANPIT